MWLAITCCVLVPLTAAWARAFWRVWVRGDTQYEDFDEGLARLNLTYWAGLLLLGAWWGVTAGLIARN